MIQRYIAIFLLLIIFCFVVTNTVLLKQTTKTFIEEVKNLELNSAESLNLASQIDTKFKQSVSFIGLTVSHEDLTNIEDCFAELTGYLSVGDTDGAEVAKHRLIRHLEHLRRLIGFNIDAII